jgi:hypothetical protein
MNEDGCRAWDSIILISLSPVAGSEIPRACAAVGTSQSVLRLTFHLKILHSASGPSLIRFSKYLAICCLDSIISNTTRFEISTVRSLVSAAAISADGAIKV